MIQQTQTSYVKKRVEETVREAENFSDKEIIRRWKQEKEEALKLKSK